MKFPKVKFNEVIGMYQIITSDGTYIDIPVYWQGQQLKIEIESVKKEFNRLKEGNFTEEEFQNLCHNFSPDDEERFKAGCKEYQNKLFGK